VGETPLTRTRWLAGEWDHGAALSRPVSFPATSVSQSSRGLVSRRSTGWSNDAESWDGGNAVPLAFRPRAGCVSQGETMTRDTSREKDDSSLFCLNDDGRENRGEEKHVKFNITREREREREGGREGGGGRRLLRYRLCDIVATSLSRSRRVSRCVETIWKAESTVETTLRRSSTRVRPKGG